MIYVVILHNGESHDEAWEAPIAYAATRKEADDFIKEWSSREKHLATRQWDEKKDLITDKYASLYPSYVYKRSVKTPTHSRVIAPEMHKKYAEDCKVAEAEYATATEAYNAAYRAADAAKAAEIAALGPRPRSIDADLVHIDELPSVAEWNKE